MTVSDSRRAAGIQAGSLHILWFSAHNEEMTMGFLTWVVLGLIVGILAKWIMPGKDGGGFFMTVILGWSALWWGLCQHPARDGNGHRLQPAEHHHRHRWRPDRAVCLQQAAQLRRSHPSMRGRHWRPRCFQPAGASLSRPPDLIHSFRPFGAALALFLVEASNKPHASQ